MKHLKKNKKLKTQRNLGMHYLYSSQVVLNFGRDFKERFAIKDITSDFYIDEQVKAKIFKSIIHFL